MKRIEWKLLCGLVLLALFATSTYAESTREQLKQMVGQLQQSPSDNALREKIIKLAQQLKPALAVPDAAVEFEGRAQFAFKSAQSNDDFLAAAREYEKAVTAAPWVSGYYSDLCTIYEKAGKFEDAKRNCEFSLIGLADAAQITDIKRRIAGLKYGMEQNSPSVVAEREQKKERKFIKNLDGARFVKREHWDYQGGGSTDYMQIYEIRGSRAFRATMTIACQGLDWCNEIGVVRWLANASSDKVGYLITGNEFVIPRDDQLCRELQSRCVDQVQNISDDGNKITERLTSRGVVAEIIFLREK